MKYFCILAFLNITFASCAQKTKSKIRKDGVGYVYFLDSVNIDKSEFIKFDVTQTAKISVYHGDEAFKLIGPDGREGVVYIETKNFAKRRYWKYFKNKSLDYTRIVLYPESDSSVQYILNGKILKSNFEGELALINDEIFEDIKVIDSINLQKKYSITDKTFGVIIKCRKVDSYFSTEDD